MCKRICQDKIGKYLVSTIRLSWPYGQDGLYETMIFEGEEASDIYSPIWSNTKTDALNAHEGVLRNIRKDLHKCKYRYREETHIFPTL